jgi:hypothetical protein
MSSKKRFKDIVHEYEEYQDTVEQKPFLDIRPRKGGPG